ncbi:MAG: catechol 2,3-dioxygenase-like lactoylglutathione lyase family enzyme [Candidatus Krumholzibacteriia bacterium]|jgi:catechol 2,3-dioxygenase-like lactoylglutathione lyase family enzyme
MKRMHIHVGVENLDQSIKFYSALFGAEPAKTKEDYAKWMLEDPRINFAISTGATKVGVDHLGMQVDSQEELTEVRGRMEKADMSVFDEGEAVCCYSRSEKSWVKDTSGVSWEFYQTMEDVQTFAMAKDSTDTACCTPDARGLTNCD